MIGLARFAAWAGAFFGLWLLLVGTNTGVEELGAAGAAILGAIFERAVARARTRRIAPPLDWILRLGQVPWSVLAGTGVVLLALVRPRRGGFRAVARPVRGAKPAAAGRRALLAFAGSLQPSTYVVDVDSSRGTALVHDLDRRRARELP
jgi:multisubunit Na+/H+ antiporter MnhE subunit